MNQKLTCEKTKKEIFMESWNNLLPVKLVKFILKKINPEYQERENKQEGETAK